MRFLSLLVTLLSLLVINEKLQAAGRVVVNSRASNSLLEFDIETGAAQVIGQYPSGWNVRNLAIDDFGNFYSSMNLGSKNVVKMVPQPNGLLGPVSFTPNIGGSGTGEIQFYQGNLYVAGDASDRIYVHNGVTGAQLGTIASSTSFNIRAMQISTAGILYYSEIFQNRVRRFDLNTNPPTGSTLIASDPNLYESHAMTIGANGNLFIVNRQNTLIQEFDEISGNFLGTLVDINDYLLINQTSISDIYYDQTLNNYFVTSGTNLLRLDSTGGLIQSYTSELLGGSTGIVVIPVPEPSSCIVLGLVISGLGFTFYKRHKNANLVK